ncbi:hypothetical protein LB505_010904 [Fusarium chuoi]|nr:hypothetical protein LB505_010904 [Fusarium chuoi]
MQRPVLLPTPPPPVPLRQRLPLPLALPQSPLPAHPPAPRPPTLILAPTVSMETLNVVPSMFLGLQTSNAIHLGQALVCLTPVGVSN